MIEAELYDGKYKVVFDDKGDLYAERYGERWRELTGDGMILAMLQEIDKLKSQINSSEGLDGLQHRVGVWGEETFKRATLNSILEHLAEEVEELKESHEPSEAADVLLILLHFCHRKGFSLLDEAIKKHEYVKANYQWSEPDEKGVVRHIKS